MAISVGDAVLQITGNSTDLDRELKAIDGKVKGISAGMAKKMKVAGAAMTGMGVAITAAMGFAVKGAADFETGMREVNTMMGLSGKEFEDFSKDVQELAADMGVNAVAASKALYQAISAGVPKENAIDFLRIATKAAIGGVTDTETAVDGLTTVLNAFKMPMSDAERVADIMFTTVKGGKTTMEELAASMFNVAPIAAAAGIEFEEVSAAIATLTKQGVPTAQATTQIRQAVVAFIKPTKEMTDALTALGYESGDALISEKGLAGALNILTEQAGGSMEILGKMFGSVEGLGAVLALTGENAQTFATDIAAMGDAAGASTAAFEEMENSTSRQMEKLKESISSVGISIGNILIPILKDIVDKIKPVITAIMDWVAKNPGLTKVIVIGTAALGALMMVLGPILMILPGIIAALPILGVAFAALTGPVGIAIAAIAAIIAIGVLLVKNWDKVKEGMAKVWEGIVAGFKWYINLYIKGINWLISMLNKISFKIPEWVPGVGGKQFGINIPQIPSFQGFEGIIPGIPGTPMLATVHAGEYIGQGGGNTVNIYNPSVRSDQDISEMTRQVTREMYRMQQLRTR